VLSGAQQPGEPGDTYNQERRGGNEVQSGKSDKSREIVIPSGHGHAHESSPVTRQRTPATRVPAPDISQRIPCCSTKFSLKTPCDPSPQKLIGTPAQLREPTRTPLLYSRLVTRSLRETPEGAKREEGGENADIFFCGEAGPRAPRCPLKLTEQAGPNGPEAHTVASPWEDLRIHTSGPPCCKAHNSSNGHTNANDPQSIKIPTSKDCATCPNRGVTRHPRLPAPNLPPGRQKGVDRAG